MHNAATMGAYLLTNVDLSRTCVLTRVQIKERKTVMKRVLDLQKLALSKSAGSPEEAQNSHVSLTLCGKNSHESLTLCGR